MNYANRHEKQEEAHVSDENPSLEQRRKHFILFVSSIGLPGCRTQIDTRPLPARLVLHSLPADGSMKKYMHRDVRKEEVVMINRILKMLSI